MELLKPMPLENLKTYSLKDRVSKVSVEDCGSVWTAGDTMSLWLERLPNILAGRDLRVVITRLAKAVEQKKSVIVAMGAHTIKVGLSPIILDLMERGIVTGLAMNGAGIIHDVELAMIGATSEDVDAELPHGTFGMARETGEFINNAIRQGAEKGGGLGYSVGEHILNASFPHGNMSLLAGAVKMNIPVTVHVAIGTDIIHIHPAVDGAATGKTSHRDFRTFATMVSGLEGGVYFNLGSAVILPEVFLKALTLVRNLGYAVKNFTTVDMDFIRQYRPMTNVVKRPTLEGGEGFYLTGHNEIMFPLLAAGLIEALEKK